MISEVDIRDWGYYPTKPIESREQYEHYLSYHDWTFEYSDDHGVWKRGIQSLKHFAAASELFDPDNLLWKKYAPAG